MRDTGEANIPLGIALPHIEEGNLCILGNAIMGVVIREYVMTGDATGNMAAMNAAHVPVAEFPIRLHLAMPIANEFGGFIPEEAVPNSQSCVWDTIDGWLSLRTAASAPTGRGISHLYQ